MSMVEERIAILVPCLDEALTVAQVVQDFKRVLPAATVYVYDNGSTDDTAALAQQAGAVVYTDWHRGKGKVMQRMFSEIEADYYVLVDGDATYVADDVLAMLEPVRSGRIDMMVGNRLDSKLNRDSLTASHRFGNFVFVQILNLLFRAKFKDIFSGYRVMNRSFVKNFPLVAKGFEVEAEMTLFALEKNYNVAEQLITYKLRPASSESKLRTFADGFKILFTIFNLLRDYRPMTFFFIIALVFFIPGLALGLRVTVEYLQTGLVLRLPTAVLAVGLILVSVFVILSGFIISTINRRFAELDALVQKRTYN